jgi:elongator complex protein 3
LDRALREIVEKLLQIDVPSRSDLDQVKIDVARHHKLPRIPRNSEILATLTEEEAELLLPILRRKEARTLSGVSVVAVMTAPYPCPHGRCAYCPGGPEEDSPQSYTGYEPAAMRGAQNEYDPYRQVKARIKQLETIGHIVDKVDLIIMGGTFPASPRQYQESFVKGCLDALTDIVSPNLVETKLNAEKSGVRNVGITVETRPDYIKKKDIDGMLELGVTRVELGVQNIYDDVYQRVGRGHNIRDVVDATKCLKDSALKICYHMMPGLPGSNPERDLEGFKTIFEDPRFKPDMLKIYPTLVVKGTRLYDWWRRGEYTPLTTGDAAELVSEIMELTPPWVRIMRVQRDIPLPRIDAGVDMSNLRQLAEDCLEARGGRCRCIRCREVGHSSKKADLDKLEITHIVYNASDGTEDFIQVEDKEADTLVGFVRLRIPDEPTRLEIDSHTGLIRELHVYGRMVPVGERRSDAWQHRGWGEALMAEAEKTARERYDMRRMIVMSALGTKHYYARLGYVKEGVYVSKPI